MPEATEVLWSQLTQEFISLLLFMFHVKYLKSNLNWLVVQVKIPAWMFSKAHVNVTHNATQRLKKVIFGLALPTECVCRKLSDQTVVMTEKEKKRAHATTTNKKQLQRKHHDFCFWILLVLLKSAYTGLIFWSPITARRHLWKERSSFLPLPLLLTYF